MRRFAIILPGFLLGCVAEPAAITFDGEPTVTLHALDKVPVQKAVARDASGAAILPAPTLTWTIVPASVATLDRDRVVPVANGTAVVRAERGGVEGSYALVVALPDRLELTGYDPAVPWPVGEARPLVATVYAGDDPLPDQVVTWAAANPNLVTLPDAGVSRALLPGSTTLTATSGELTARVDVVVTAP